jgi:glycosyltransferase involved in cell wall biosynthesis
VQLHQARALCLTSRWQPRTEDYIAEVHANHPDAPADLPYLVLAGMADGMYQHWPMVRLVIERAQMTVVHNHWVADDLRHRHPGARLRTIEMGVSAIAPDPDAGRRVRAELSIPERAIVIAAFGGVTPEKRITQVIRAIAATADRHPDLYLLLVGTRAAHYDAAADAAAAGLGGRVRITGFVADEVLPAHLAASDLCACLRWPTNRETSASWLRCLAAARPTLITELAHLGHVPTLDPRGWRLLTTAREPCEPAAVSIDPLDEDHSLQLALERLVIDRALRERLGRAGHAWWQAHHQLDAMADDYLSTLALARDATPAASVLPPHLVDDGTSRLRQLIAALGVAERVIDLMPHSR